MRCRIGSMQEHIDLLKYWYPQNSLANTSVQMRLLELQRLLLSLQWIPLQHVQSLVNYLGSTDKAE